MNRKEVTALDEVKKYLRIDDDSEDTLIQMCIESAEQYIKDYTGLTDDEINSNQALQMAKMAIIADLFELRQATTTGLQLNPFVDYVLNMYQRNLL